MAQLRLPMPPTFDSVEEERLQRKQRLAAAFRLFAHFGFEEGVAGHITARDPERADHFWVNPFGEPFAHMRVRDLVLINDKGEIVEGDRPVNGAAFAIHSQVHAARPDVVAAAHSHSMYGKSWSALGRLLDPLTQDACTFYGDHALFDDYTGVVLDVEEGKRIAHAPGARKAVILRNHGRLSVGHSVDEAAVWIVAAALVIAPACGGDHRASGSNDNSTSSTAVPSGRGGATGDPARSDVSTTMTSQPASGRGGATGAGGTGGVSTSTTSGSSTTT